ncbi:FkbM family methyltransferase [Anabaena azotica]|uniref:FkbM family methyltransferase n=1 Tax=Anabaena azotica TaxID=197653 RepID=UPI0039A43DA4
MNIIKKIVKKQIDRILKLTPYELSRRPLEIPPPTFETVSLALAYYIQIKPNGTFVQVGACDGITGDPVHHLIKQSQIKSVLIEPMEQSFLKLQQAYANIPNVITYQAAVAQQDGNATIFTVKDCDRWRDFKWATQWSSFNKSHLIKHKVREEEIEEITVPTVTLSTLISHFNLGNIDFLMIDTEGFDAEIVKMSLLLPTVPECIYFEHAHLDPQTRIDLQQELKNHNYVWVYDKLNTLAIHSKLKKRWT